MPQVANGYEYAVESHNAAGSQEKGKGCEPVPGLPEYEYPVPVVIRNTFIETLVGRPESLDQFFEERRIHSCPAVHPRPEDCVGGSRTPKAQPMSHAITAGLQAFMTKVATDTGLWMGLEHGSSTQPIDNFNSSQPQMPVAIKLSDALPEAELGAQQLPTVGSLGHYSGTCKPCAFFYTKGCEGGTQCSFCHLCPPDEKRRRQKEKQAAFRDMRRQRRQVRL